MLFKILKGPSSRISTDVTPFHEGYAYVTEDGGDFYVDLVMNGVETRVQINPDEIPAGGKDGQLLTKTADGWAWKDAPKTVSASAVTPKMDGTAAVGSDSGYAKGDHVHPTDTTRQAKITANGVLKGDGKGGVTGGTVSKEELASDVQTSLGKADSALQSFTETDPTVPAWAKATTKPTYTKSEVGLGNVDNTSDANKPISTATQTALDAKAADSAVVHKTGDETVSGVKTFNAPANKSGTEQATIKFKTANGGSLTVGKEAANAGTMLRFDQVDGTTRLRFRSSSTAGAMVWEQPEQGAQLYVDLGKDGSDKHRVSFPTSAGTLALQSAVDAKVPTSRKINGHALTADVTITKADIGLGNVANVALSAMTAANVTSVWNSITV